MSINYKPLWKLLIEKEMKKQDFRKLVGISKSTLDRMGRNEYISMRILDEICDGLKCTPNDVIEHQPTKK